MKKEVKSCALQYGFIINDDLEYSTEKCKICGINDLINCEYICEDCESKILNIVW